jgi:hypothetical protein
MIDLGLTIKKGKRIYANTRDKKWFTGSLEISRLKIVIDFVEDKGYQPLFYCESSMRDFLTSEWA